MNAVTVIEVMGRIMKEIDVHERDQLFTETVQDLYVAGRQWELLWPEKHVRDISRGLWRPSAELHRRSLI